MGIGEFLMIVGTVVGGFGGIAIYILTRMRNGDLAEIKSLHDLAMAESAARKADSDNKIQNLTDNVKMLKADSDTKISNLDLKVNDVYTNMQAKLDKSEHRIDLARIEREIADLRNDQKLGQAEIRQDLKDMRQDLMQAIRDIKS